MDNRLQIVTTPDGWSLHDARATDEEIAEGTHAGRVLLSGDGVPTQAEIDRALAAL